MFPLDWKKYARTTYRITDAYAVSFDRFLSCKGFARRSKIQLQITKPRVSIVGNVEYSPYYHYYALHLIRWYQFLNVKGAHVDQNDWRNTKIWLCLLSPIINCVQCYFCASYCGELLFIKYRRADYIIPFHQKAVRLWKRYFSLPSQTRGDWLNKINLFTVPHNHQNMIALALRGKIPLENSNDRKKYLDEWTYNFFHP